MKKIWLSVFLSLAVLAIPVVSLAEPKPVFDNTSTASYEGVARTGNIMVTALMNGTLQKVHFIAKNKGNSGNATLSFTNLSGVKAADGSIIFSTDGVWVGFSGPYMQPNINLYRGTVPAWGAVKVGEGDVTFNPAFRNISGVSGTTGSIVVWNGNVDFRGVLKSGGARGMLKAMIHPTTANLVTFANNSSTSTPAVLRISLPAIQMDRM